MREGYRFYYATCSAKRPRIYSGDRQEMKVVWNVQGVRYPDITAIDCLLSTVLFFVVSYFC
jgi:hypothetical protein